MECAACLGSNTLDKRFWIIELSFPVIYQIVCKINAVVVNVNRT